MNAELFSPNPTILHGGRGDGGGGMIIKQKKTKNKKTHKILVKIVADRFNIEKKHYSSLWVGKIQSPLLPNTSVCGDDDAVACLKAI